MTTTTTTVFAAAIIAALIASLTPPVHGLGGSASTYAVVYGSPTVCGIVAEQQFQSIQCWNNDRGLQNAEPRRISYDYIAGGRDGFCAVRSGGFSLICWNSSFVPKRIYNNDSALLEDLTIGDGQICALTNGTRGVKCWREDDSVSSAKSPDESEQFDSVSSGLGFSCGVSTDSGRVVCWGSDSVKANRIQSQFVNISMSTIVVGGNQTCGFNQTGYMICRGLGNPNFSYPSDSPFEFSGFALGENHGCAVRRSNGSVVCWGVASATAGEFSSNVTEGVSFESVVAGLDFTCGLTTSNFSIICWGPGWPSDSIAGVELPLPKILPGPCVKSTCSDCGVYPQSDTLCSGTGNICRPCNPTPISSPPSSSPPPLPPPPPPLTNPKSPPSKALRKGLLAFAIIGSVGVLSGICTLLYCMWTGVCFGNKKIHNSVQPTITQSNSNGGGGGGGVVSNNSPVSRSSTIRRQSSRAIRRQRSGTSTKHPDRAEEFTFADLANATNNFSLENKIGGGSYGIVYKGKLSDGREVAIKRGETSLKMKKFQEKESAFDSELAFLSRLHHKHLVRLVGYCEERDEKLLVYDYMKNGALYDHLHAKNNVEKGSSLLNSWKMRIKVSLDAARGIEYLHNYAVPPIIHRDIKTSNILLDSNWTARVSDFGLSLMGPVSDQDYRPSKAAGTVGYIDPEYYGLNVLTTKSDVYGLGVVLLELLTGKRAIFKSGEDGGSPTSVVDFAVPAIMAGDLGRILDTRVGPPDLHESEAVELVAYTAMHCVNLEGKDRPTMSDIVANLDRALVLCEDSHGSISSSGRISIVSEERN